MELRVGDPALPIPLLAPIEEAARRAAPAEAAALPRPAANDRAGETAISAATPWLRFLTLQPTCDTGLLLYFCGVKRCLDVVVASVLLLAASPLLLLIALAIRLDSPGPILFRQWRIGRHGRPFVVYKFRTMTRRAAPAVQLFVDADGRPRHKLPSDPRVTHVGRWLRKTSLDEIPQMLNVVRGEMSLVGPRPEIPEIVAQYAPWQHRRHLVRPGLTGWWQVQGRSDRPMHEHTELDVYYVEHLSWRLDLTILWRTVRVVLFGSGAF